MLVQVRPALVFQFSGMMEVSGRVPITKLRLSSTTMFPGEIIDRIVDFLDNDTRTLLNVSLTNSTWLPSGRARLFRAVRINPQTVQKFLQLLKHPLSTFASSVKHIDISGINYFHPDFLSLDIPELGECCCNVVSLNIFNLSFNETGTERYSPLVKNFSKLERLQLDGLVFVSVSQMMNLLCGFPLLHTAILHNIAWEDPSTDGEDELYPYKIPSTLRELSIDACYKRDVMRCFLNHDPFPDINKLDLGILSPSDTQAIGEYLARIGPTLDHLSLGFSSLDAGGDAEDFFLNCDLGYNTSLQTVHIHRLIDYWKYRLTSPVPWNLKSLAQIRSEKLEEVSFSLYMSHVSQLDVEDLPVDFDWNEMDRFFVEGNLPHLKVVRLLLSVDTRTLGFQVEDAIGALWEKLPLSRSKGLLRFGQA